MKLNLLVAYPYFKADLLGFLEDKKEEINLLIDSGAFTAWKSGKEINLEEYSQYLRDFPFTPFGYFTLDKIGDGKASLRNYKILLEEGLKPIPIFTRGENPEVLEEYYKTSEVVGIGGLVGTKGNKGYVKGIMEKIGNRKVHWLGYTNRDYLGFYKPYMCDCSSWSYSARYGYLLVYNFKGGFDTIYRKDFVTGKVPKNILTNIRRLGLNPVELLDNDNWIGSEKYQQLHLEVTARGYIRKSLDAKKFYNTNMFLAVGALGHAKLIYNAYKEVLKGLG